jgi:DNA primase
MRFEERFLLEIKFRLRPSDVIGRTVKLRRAGREYVGLSPFTKERTPSFYVNDEKGSFFDFSSGKTGDLISFLQETERLSFREAVERLAGEAGVAMPSPDPREAEREARRQHLCGWMEEAARWFEAQLRWPKGEGARRYLDGRALPEAERTRFRLGYAPADRTALKDHLIAKGARPGELVDAGLLVQPEDGGALHDRFRDRIMFPITDTRGRIVSFGGRALDSNRKAKYLNGPESPLFHKGSTLYLLTEARKRLHTRGEEPAALVVVEGYMDAIACHRAGIAAVAPMGAALTQEQMAALWRLAAEPVLCFDGDEAGQRAAYRTIDRALPLLKPGRSFRFALPTGGKDPDEVLREQGAAALKAELSATKPLAEMLFARERAAAGELDTPERRAGFKATLHELAGMISDPGVAQAYRDDFQLRLQTVLPQSYRGRSPVKAGYPQRVGRPLRPQVGASADGKAAAHRLARAVPPAASAAALALVRFPELLDRHLEALETFGVGAPALDAFVETILQERLTDPAAGSAKLRADLVERGQGSMLEVLATAAAHSGAPFLKPHLPFEEVGTLWERLHHALLRIAALESETERLKVVMTDDPSALAELHRTKAERDALRRALASGDLWDRPA